MKSIKLYSSVSSTNGLPPTKAVIDREALAENFKILRKKITEHAPRTRAYRAVFKSDRDFPCLRRQAIDL